MIPTFDMYVYGSLQSYVGILNAVAMVFNQGGFMTSVYMLGGLLMLVLTLAMASSYAAGPQQIFKNVAIFAVLVSLGGIKSTVNIQDIYTGQLNRVDNVPLLLSFPASAATTAFYGVLDKTSTAYQGANASYVSISQGGFMDPLKELLAMRRGLASSNPALVDTTRQFIVNCWNNANASGNVEGLMKDRSGLQYLLVNGSVPAWTVNYIGASNKTDGDSVVCSDAADKIWAEAQAYLWRDVGTGASLLGQVKQQLPSIGPRAGGSINLDLAKFNKSVNGTLSALSVSGQTTQEQMLNLLTMDLVGDTFGCIQESAGSPAKLTSCATQTIALTQGLEQWKADAAGNASFFQGIMIPASMFIQMLAIALFPIIFIVAVLAVGSAMKLILAYVTLIAWSASWAPVAAAIQWVMQMVLNEDISKFKSGLNYGNVGAFYNTVSTDLAIGADMLAATPLIAFAVLSGSAYAFTQLAGRWSSDRVNEKIAAPDLQSPGAVNSVGSRQTTDAGLGSSYTTGESLSKLDVNSAISSGLASSKQNSLRAAESWSKTHEFGSDEASGLVKALRQSNAASESFSRNLEKSAGLSESDRAELRGSVGASLSTPGISPAQVRASIEASGMSSVGKEKAIRATESMGEDFKKVNEASTAVDNSFRSFQKMSASHGYQDGIEMAKSYQESSTLARGMGVSQSISANQFGQYYRDASEAGRMQFDQLRGVAAKEFMPGGELHGRNKSYSGLSMGSDYGMVESLLKSSNARHVQMGASMVGALSGSSVNTNYTQYSGLESPASGAARTAYNSGPSSSVPVGNIEDPTNKVGQMVGGTGQKIAEGQQKIEGTGLGDMAGEHLKNNLANNLPSPRALLPDSK